jgi:c-di-GMP-binding flagellar brake protein YcgR
MGGFSREEERRKFIRIDEHHLLKYKVCENDQVLSFVRNISGGGVLFHSKDPVEVGTTLEMRISLPPEEKPIDVVVKVRHIKELKKLGGYNVGAEFVHIDEKDRSLIERKIYPSDEDRTDAA